MKQLKGKCRTCAKGVLLTDGGHWVHEGADWFYHQFVVRLAAIAAKFVTPDKEGWINQPLESGRVYYLAGPVVIGGGSK